MGRIILPGGKFVPEADPKNRSADQILNNPLIPTSTWHIFQALSWIDLAKRRRIASALLYAAIELRYGLEYLLFELLIVADPKLTETEYKECIGSPKKIKKLLESTGRLYSKRAEFTKVILSLQPRAPRLQYWDIGELFSFWGNASSYLHFLGSHQRTYQDPDWLTKGIAKLEPIVATLFDKAQMTHGVGLLSLKELPPEVQTAWDEFFIGKLSAENLRIRMKILLPILNNRQKGSF